MPELKRILCVDDEADLRAIEQMCLETVGDYEVLQAANGEEAIRVAREQKPDIILLDVMMPGMDGPTALSRMREDATIAHIPVIFMTARVRPSEIEEYIAQGAIGVISKPFDPMQLAQQVETFWNNLHDQ